MVEVDDGWVELPAVHDPIVQTRFEKKTLLRLRAAEHIWYPTRFPFFPINWLPQDSRSCVTPLNDSHQVAIFQRRHLHRRWLKVCMMNSAADVASATTLCDVEPNRLHWLCIVNPALKFLRRNGEDERAEVGQVQCDRAGAFCGVRLHFRLEIDLKREICN